MRKQKLGESRCYSAGAKQVTGIEMGKMQRRAKGRAVGAVQPAAGVSGRGFKRDRETHVSFICSYYHRVPADLNSVSKKMFCWSAFQTIAVVIKFFKLIFN